MISLPKFLPCNNPIKAAGALSMPSMMSSRYLSWPERTSGAAISRYSERSAAWSETIKPWILSRLRTAATRLGRGVVVLGDHATHDHAAEIVEQRIYRALHIAADILEIHI